MQNHAKARNSWKFKASTREAAEATCASSPLVRTGASTAAAAMRGGDAIRPPPRYFRARRREGLGFPRIS